MLDYEILNYKVEYHIIGAACIFEREFDAEDKAIDFIRENRYKWDDYKLTQTRSAIIDF